MFGIFPAGYGTGHPYTPILIYFIGVAFMCMAFAFLPSFITPRQRLKGKVAPYECGIDVEDGRITQFDVRFYLVAMLFLVFDCEIVFLFPYGVTLKKVPVAGFISVVSFLTVLIVGFVYEWKKKSLDW